MKNSIQFLSLLYTLTVLFLLAKTEAFAQCETCEKLLEKPTYSKTITNQTNIRSQLDNIFKQYNNRQTSNNKSIDASVLIVTASGLAIKPAFDYTSSDSEHTEQTIEQELHSQFSSNNSSKIDVKIYDPIVYDKYLQCITELCTTINDKNPIVIKRVSLQDNLLELDVRRDNRFAKNTKLDTFAYKGGTLISPPLVHGQAITDAPQKLSFEVNLKKEPFLFWLTTSDFGLASPFYLPKADADTGIWGIQLMPTFVDNAVAQNFDGTKNVCIEFNKLMDALGPEGTWESIRDLKSGFMIFRENKSPTQTEFRVVYFNPELASKAALTQDYKTLTESKYNRVTWYKFPCPQGKWINHGINNNGCLSQYDECGQ